MRLKPLDTVVSQPKMSCGSSPHILYLRNSEVNGKICIRLRQERCSFAHGWAEKWKQKCRSTWMINWSDNDLLLAFLKEVAGMTVAVHSHCETVLINWIVTVTVASCETFCCYSKCVTSSERQLSRASNGQASMPHVVACFFEVSVSVRQVTVNEMTIK